MIRNSIIFCFISSKLSLDLIEKWLSNNSNGSALESLGGGLNISGIAAYQPFDGLMELKVVIFCQFMLIMILIQLKFEFF